MVELLSRDDMDIWLFVFTPGWNKDGELPWLRRENNFAEVMKLLSRFSKEQN